MLSRAILLLCLAPCAAFSVSGVAPVQPVSMHPAARSSAPQLLSSCSEQCVDEAALLAESTFPIKPEALIAKCKEVMDSQMGIQDRTIDESIYADDFRFCAPFVGGPTNAKPSDPLPGLGKEEYLSALRSFNLLEAFPDMNGNYHFFRVDPFEPNRVWFQTGVTATHTGKEREKTRGRDNALSPPY